jgi:hypothetical protein
VTAKQRLELTHPATEPSPTRSMQAADQRGRESPGRQDRAGREVYVVLAKNQVLPSLARGRIWLGRCLAGLPDGLEAGSARPAVVGTMGGGGLDVLRAAVPLKRLCSNDRLLRPRMPATSRLSSSLPRSPHGKRASVGHSGRARDLARPPRTPFDCPFEHTL